MPIIRIEETGPLRLGPTHAVTVNDPGPRIPTPATTSTASEQRTSTEKRYLEIRELLDITKSDHDLKKLLHVIELVQKNEPEIEITMTTETIAPEPASEAAPASSEPPAHEADAAPSDTPAP